MRGKLRRSLSNMNKKLKNKSFIWNDILFKVCCIDQCNTVYYLKIITNK